jgi:hypothetical protein
MAEMLKGFGLLSLALLGGVAAYLSWLTLLPVTQADADIRIANVCWGGQMLGSAFDGPNHRPISCECMSDGLTKTLTPIAIAKGSEAMRQLFVAQMWRAATQDKSVLYDRTAMTDRDVLIFVARVQELDRACAKGAFAARK